MPTCRAALIARSSHAVPSGRPANRSGGSARTRFAWEEVAAAAKDPVIAAALAARERLNDAFAAQDFDTTAALSAKDQIVNTPANRVARRETLLGFFKAGRM